MSDADRWAVVDALARAQRVAVVMHVLPDGDTTGSALGLAAVLVSRGQAVSVLGPDPVLPAYRFLPGAEAVVVGPLAPNGTAPQADVVVTVDCGHPDRCFGEAALRRLAPRVVNIDHHRSNPRFGDINWVEPDRASVGDMLVDLCEAAGWPVTVEAALCLYVSVVSDTEGLRFGYHDHRGLETAARLVRVGLDPDRIARQLWEHQTWPRARLAGWMWSHVEHDPSRRVVWVRVPADVQRELGARPEDAEGLISGLRALEGVQLALFFREEESGAVKVSIRSRPPFAAGPLAERLGGGGHEHAAGIVLGPGLHAAVRSVLALVEHECGETMSWTDLSV